MSDKLTFTLHELVSELDNAADSLLTSKYGISGSQFVFIATLAATSQLTSPRWPAAYA